MVFAMADGQSAAQRQLDAGRGEVCRGRLRRCGLTGDALMSALLGALAGNGLLLIWWSAWEQPRKPEARKRTSRLEDLLGAAGLKRFGAAGLLVTCLAVAAFTRLLFFAVTRSWPISVCFGLFGGWLPVAIVRWRARKRTTLLRQLWPDVVDHLRSAIRAGLSLPEALIQLGEKGPEELRPVFSRLRRRLQCRRTVRSGAQQAEEPAGGPRGRPDRRGLCG